MTILGHIKVFYIENFETIIQIYKYSKMKRISACFALIIIFSSFGEFKNSQLIKFLNLTNY